jgi:hypothetical protein
MKKLSSLVNAIDLTFMPSSFIREVYKKNIGDKTVDKETIAIQYMFAEAFEIIRLVAYNALIFLPN